MTLEQELKNKVKKGSVDAALKLAGGLLWGMFGDSDPVRAAGMYRICCRSSKKEVSSLGFYHLGNLYYYGFLRKENEPEDKHFSLAFSCFLKSALKCHNPDALRRLGDMYRYGQGVEKNEAISLALYLRAGQKDPSLQETAKA